MCEQTPGQGQVAQATGSGLECKVQAASTEENILQDPVHHPLHLFPGGPSHGLVRPGLTPLTLLEVFSFRGSLWVTSPFNMSVKTIGTFDHNKWGFPVQGRTG